MIIHILVSDDEVLSIGPAELRFREACQFYVLFKSHYGPEVGWKGRRFLWTCYADAFLMAIASLKDPSGHGSQLLSVAQRTLSFSELPSGLGKEGSNQVGLPSKSAESEVELLMQLFEVPADKVVHFHVFEVVPTSFVPRGQIRGQGEPRCQHGSLSIRKS